MTSFGELIDSVRSTLHGFAQDQEQYATLAGALAAAGLSFAVTPTTIGEISRGLIEIEDELLLVESTNPSSATITIMPGGRGFESSTAADHAENALVVNNPKFPRANIRRAINDTIRSTFPDLFQVATTTLTAANGVFSYELPAATGTVLTVRANQVGGAKVAMPVRAWSFNPSADTTVFTSGKSLDIGDLVTPGRSIRVVYTLPPATLATAADDFAAITGLPESCSDLVVFGACYRLLPAYEAARLQQDAIESSERAMNVPAGAATQISKYYFGLYQQRLAEERGRLQRLHPIMSHYSF